VVGGTGNARTVAPRRPSSTAYASGSCKKETSNAYCPRVLPKSAPRRTRPPANNRRRHRAWALLQAGRVTLPSASTRKPVCNFQQRPTTSPRALMPPHYANDSAASHLLRRLRSPRTYNDPKRSATIEPPAATAEAWATAHTGRRPRREVKALRTDADQPMIARQVPAIDLPFGALKGAVTLSCACRLVDGPCSRFVLPLCAVKTPVSSA
jgi:hypothetical protein